MNWETFHDVFSSFQLKKICFSIKDLREYTLKPGAWFVLQGGGARIIDLMLPFQFTFYFVVCSGVFASWVSSTNWCSPRKLSASFRQGITSLCSEGRLWESCCPRPLPRPPPSSGLPPWHTWHGEHHLYQRKHHTLGQEGGKGQVPQSCEDVQRSLALRWNLKSFLMLTQLFKKHCAGPAEQPVSHLLTAFLWMWTSTLYSYFLLPPLPVSALSQAHFSCGAFSSLGWPGREFGEQCSRVYWSHLLLHFPDNFCFYL